MAYTFLVLSRIAVGFGEAGYGPAAPALIADYYPIEKRGRIMALFYLAIPVGSALGYVIGGKVNDMWGWRYAFYLAVIPGLILAAICFTMKDPRPPQPVDVKRASLIEDAKALLRIPSYALNTAAMTAMTFAIGGIGFWIPKYMLERVGELNPTQSQSSLLNDVNTTFGVIVVVAGILSTFAGGWLGDKLRPRWPGSYFIISGVAIAFAFPCTILMIYLPFPYTWFAVFGAVFFLFFNTGPANTALANVTGSRMRASAFALNIFLIHALGDAISPPLIGYVKKHTNWETAFSLVSLMMVLASVLWLIGARYLGRDTEAASRIE
jgi:MFS family permease